jgi:hypothetical protein
MPDGGNGKRSWIDVLKIFGGIAIFVLGAVAGVASERGQYMEKVDNLTARMTPVEQAVMELKEMNRELKTRQDFAAREIDKLREAHEGKK